MNIIITCNALCAMDMIIKCYKICVMSICKILMKSNIIGVMTVLATTVYEMTVCIMIVCVITKGDKLMRYIDVV